MMFMLSNTVIIGGKKKSCIVNLWTSCIDKTFCSKESFISWVVLKKVNTDIFTPLVTLSEYENIPTNLSARVSTVLARKTISAFTLSSLSSKLDFNASFSVIAISLSKYFLSKSKSSYLIPKIC